MRTRIPNAARSGAPPVSPPLPLPFVGIVWPLEEISPFFCLVPIVIPVVVYHIGYTLGYKRISIRDKLVYVDPEKQKKQHERERKFK